MGKTKTYTSNAIKLLFGTLCLLISLLGAAQAQEAKPSPTQAAAATATPATTENPPVRVAIDLKVSYSRTDKVARKQFYLFKKPIDAAKLNELQAKLGNMPSHHDYQQKTHASNEFIKNWLEKYRCETVYCRDVTAEDMKIPEFAAAYQKAKQVFGDKRDDQNQELALKWFVNFLPEEIRTGYYELKKAWVEAALKQLESEGLYVGNASTNRSGQTFFTDLDPAGGEKVVPKKGSDEVTSRYFMSNLVPIETADDCYLWIIPKEVKGTTPKNEISVIGDNSRIKVTEQLKGKDGTPLTFNCKKAASGTPAK